MKRLLLALAASISLLGMSAPAHADAFDNANAYFRAVGPAPDFTLDRSEFGPNNFVRVIHLGIELVVGAIHGYVIVYNPATGEKLIFGDSGAPFNGRTIYATDHCTLLSGKPALGVPDPMGGCLPADTLVGNAGGAYLEDVIAAVDRFCSINVDKPGAHEHSC